MYLRTYLNQWNKQCEHNCVETFVFPLNVIENTVECDPYFAGDQVRCVQLFIHDKYIIFLLCITMTKGHSCSLLSKKYEAEPENKYFCKNKTACLNAALVIPRHGEKWVFVK